MNDYLKWHQPTVLRSWRERLHGHRAVVLWFTGLPSSGKSTVAHAVEERLHELKCNTFVFDGDNVRHGLCGDLGFSRDDRTENLRRVGEMLKLFIEAGVISLAAFVSPFTEDRKRVKDLFSGYDFIEVYCECPIDVCAERDPKGHYQLAKDGVIKDFTGVSAPYEEPEVPDVRLTTATMSVYECVEAVVDHLVERKILGVDDNADVQSAVAQT